MGKISDIWVRLGLKKNEFDKGMDDAGKKAEGFGGKLNKVKAGALAVWTAIGASVVKFTKEFITHSQRFGDEWNVVVGQMKSTWSQFLTSLTNWDWDGFGKRMRDAFDAARKSVSAHDSEFEVTNSINMRKAAMAEELASLQILMRDTQKSYAVRAKAAQDYLDKIEPLYKQEIELRKGIYLADTDEYLKNAGLAATADNRDILRTFFTDIAPNSSLLAALVQYQKKVQGKKYKLTENDSRLIDDFYKQYDNQTGAALSVLATYYRGTNDKTAKKAIDAIVQYDSSLASFLEETRRVRTLQNTALAQMATDAGGDSQIQEIARLGAMPRVAEIQGNAVSMMPDLITKEWLERQRQMGLEAVEMQAEWLDIMTQGAMQMEDTIVQSMANGLQAITDMIFGLQDADAGAVLAAFIAPFGDMAKNMGAMIMSYGLSMDAFKKAFTNPYVAIAAGAGLMAIGAAISSGAQKIASGSMGGGATSYGGGSYGSSPEIQNYESTLTVEVVGRISGSDIILAGQNQQNKWNR